MIGITLTLLALCVALARAGDAEMPVLLDNYATPEPLCSGGAMSAQIAESGEDFDFTMATPGALTTFEVCVSGDFSFYAEFAEIYIDGEFYGNLGDDSGDSLDCKDEYFCHQFESVPTNGATTDVSVELSIIVEAGICAEGVLDRVVVSSCGRH